MLQRKPGAISTFLSRRNQGSDSSQTQLITSWQAAKQASCLQNFYVREQHKCTTLITTQYAEILSNASGSNSHLYNCIIIAQSHMLVLHSLIHLILCDQSMISPVCDSLLNREFQLLPFPFQSSYICFVPGNLLAERKDKSFSSQLQFANPPQTYTKFTS